MEVKVPLRNEPSSRCRTLVRGLAFLSIVFLAVSGCGTGDGKELVTGTVTFDGSPMPDGYVTFTPEGGGSPAAGPIENGKFNLSAMPGNHRVEIEASRFVGPKNPIMGLQPREQYVPARYNTDSTLRQEVKAGDSNVVDFRLTSNEE
jgi:hypothetical protein